MRRAVRRPALALAALLLASAAPQLQAEPVALASADGVALAAHWLPVPGAAGPRPAVVALHGCGGLYRRDGVTLAQRYVEAVARLHAAGVHVLLPDSFGARGVRSTCREPPGPRSVTVSMRRLDVGAALAWLRDRADVAAERIALVGWSNGATTALAALNAARPDFGAPYDRVAGAIAFYPGCGALLARPYAVRTPVLLLLGEQDDWTPPGPCLELEQLTRARQPDLQWTARVYPDSVHGFDGTAPLRFRTDVSRGVDPRGVHEGGNPAAREAAYREFDEFLRRILR